MARKDASLELRKARQNNGNLELNQAMVVRYEAVLNGHPLPPVLACSPGLVLPSVVQGQTTAPALSADAGLIYPATLAAPSPAAVAEIRGTIVIECVMAMTTQAAIHDFDAGYDVNVFRGPSHASAGDWDRAALVSSGVASDWQQPAIERSSCAADWQEAAPQASAVVELGEVMPQRYELNKGVFEEAVAVGMAHGQPFDNLPPGHAVTRALWVEAAPVDSWQVSGYRNPPRFDQVWQADQWQEGGKLGKASGQPLSHGRPQHWRWLDRWEEAKQPDRGTSPDPKPPIIPERPDKRTKGLVFGRKRGDASLEFVWYGQDARIVIPTRRVYLVSNTASIVRVRDGLDIPATSLSIELDTDSWAWQFSAQIPRIATAALTDEEEVSIHINGQQWECVCDGWQSSQSFARESATLTGRSRAAYLSPTHVLAQAVSANAAATMAQLAAAVLPFGWTLEWQAADWLVPAGFFSLDNQTPIEAVKYLAEAAGGFVLPHQRNQHLVIKPRYPTVPWQLETALADVAIPRAIITTLGSDFQPGQAANGIWVSGGHQGISARVVRQGTAGEQLAQSITHPLVCDVAAARAQGVVGLAKTMPKRTQTIELPLSDDTGLIMPGALLAMDGWKGYNRGVRVSAELQNKAMTVRQRLSVERFV
ncbi:hypothetical protein CK910_14565 [Aeromonas sp. CA23]|uniref:hypothetical protein n=1 Tax=Aeromonas sp. CA23 TaxID=2033032 RepID=UPI000BFD4302|nr:hypothetical protein [Aeromonas sp. CA23]ATL99555.1 hypothetical protein CK910_14565 [Aeromonas sp. CA23]